MSRCAVVGGRGSRSTVVLATHQTEDVAALCERVVVLDGGRVRFDGTVQDLVATAPGGCGSPMLRARRASSWRTGTGRYRNVGATAPPGAELVEPTLEDAYLLLRGDRAAAGGGGGSMTAITADSPAVSVKSPPRRPHCLSWRE